MTNPGLALADVSKSFGETEAVTRVSLSVPAASQTVLLGPSGCGKTTLLRIIAGLEVEDVGVVTVEGEQLSRDGVGMPPERRRIGMVFQDWGLFPHLTVERNIAFGLSRSRINEGVVGETLELMRIPDLAHRRPHELSAGQAQRVALARAVAPRPRILLFDEPFSSLDAELRGQVRAEVAALMRELKMTAVYVTHDQEEAFVLGDEIAVMRSGRIIQTGSPAEIYLRPETEWVATFVGDANLIDGEAHEATASTAIGTLPLQRSCSGKCRVLARPEHLSITAGSDGSITAGSDGEVVGVEFYGHDTVYQVRLASSNSHIQVRAAAAPEFSIGQSVTLSYHGPAAACFSESDSAPS